MELKKVAASQISDVIQPPTEEMLSQAQTSRLGILNVKDEIVSGATRENLEGNLLPGSDFVAEKAVHDASEIVPLPGGLGLEGLDMPGPDTGGLPGQSNESLNPQNPTRPDIHKGIGPGHFKVETPFPGPGDPAGWWDSGTGVPGPIDPTASAPVEPPEPQPAPVDPTDPGAVLKNVATVAAFPDIEGGNPPKPTMSIQGTAEPRGPREPPKPK